MIRTKYMDIHEAEVRKGLQDLFNSVKEKMQHSGDLLVCQQNGLIGFSESPSVGLGEEGLNSMAMLNLISIRGIEDLTDDEDYFNKLGGFFDGTTEFEHSLQREKSAYLNIWESNFFLRVLTQV